MDQLTEYVNDKDDLVAQTAKLLEEAITSFKEQKLTSAEYHEIVDDILDSRVIETLSENMERRERIFAIFQTLRNIVASVIF